MHGDDKAVRVVGEDPYTHRGSRACVVAGVTVAVVAAVAPVYARGIRSAHLVLVAGLEVRKTTTTPQSRPFHRSSSGQTPSPQTTPVSRYSTVDL